MSSLCFRSKGYRGYGESFLEACREGFTLRPDELATSHITVAEDGSGTLGVVQLSVSGETADLSKIFIKPSVIGRDIAAAHYAWATGKSVPWRRIHF